MWPACAPVFEDNSFVGLRAGERARAVRARCDRLVLATKEAGQGATTMGDVRDGGLEGVGGSRRTGAVDHQSDTNQQGERRTESWHNVSVRSMDDADETVLFTVEAGVYNLDIAFREEGALLGAFMMTTQLQ